MTERMWNIVDSIWGLIKTYIPYTIYLIPVFIVALLIYTVRIGQVSGNSMEPALHDGQQVVVDALTWRLFGLHEGDIVVFTNPHQPGVLDIKRVADVPGGEGEIRGAVVPLGKDDYYVVGDNFAHSTDSRDFGPVQPHDIVGRVVYSF